MTLIATERDRLLVATARTLGFAAAFVAFVCLLLPDALPAPERVAALVCVAAQCVGFWMLRYARPDAWAAGIVLAGIAAMIVIGTSGHATAATESTLAVLAGTCASAGVVAGSSDRPVLFLTACGLATTVTTGLAAGALGLPVARPLVVCAASWGIIATLAVWLGRVAPRMIRRTAGVGEAYRAERLASEQEARRRQSARLLHDTVLATLTLLAHAGRGVNEDALRQQAGEDAALLRQLRLGYTPLPEASGDYKLRPVLESTLGNTLESVKQRFQRMGLDVNWHGSGHVLLPAEQLEAFLLALSECLENVRRHSGVEQAHVTISDDDQTVRAMVTDSGVGFDVRQVEPGRLGFAESIVARLRDVGGNARLFSSPGAGTTVVLEVPK